MKTKLLLLFLVLGFIQAYSQSKIINGRVLDATTNLPLAGASISVQGTRQGGVTDSSGWFTIRLDATQVNLLVTMTNYRSQTIAAKGNGPILALLVPEVKELDQVVVIGYGTQKKKDINGAVTTVSAADIGGRRTVQISEALQGAAPGVSVTRGSAAPGATSNILIRGITTLGNNTPLIIVDGIPVSNIDNVNPNDVESLSVLKDAATAAIYGSRGAAGVILITTKRAASGRANFEYNTEFGWQKPTALPQYVNAPDYMRYFNELSVNDGAATGPYPQDYITHFADSNRTNPDKFPFANTDWQKTMMRTQYAPRQQHDLVFTLGSKNVKTKASFSYANVGSFYTNYNYERYLFRVNNDFQINNKLSADLDVTFKRTQSITPVVDPVYESRVMPSIYDDYYADGRYALGKDGRNPIAQLNEGGTNNGAFNQLTGRLAFHYKPFTGLVLTALIAPALDFNKSKYFSKRISFTNLDGTPSNFTNQPKTILTESRAEQTAITSQFLAEYNKVFKNGHTVSVLGGYEQIYNFSESESASRTGFALNDFPYLNSGAQDLRDNSGSASESALRSFFGRVTYDYKNKYSIQGILRNDLSSRFAKAYRSALFPSVMLGWTLTEESFLKGQQWLSFLKLRGSYGEVGNERIGNYPYQSTVNFSNALFYQNGVIVPLNGGAQQDYAVQNISWETTRTIDIGLEGALLDKRLSFSADYYKKRTYNILLALDIPLYLGFNKPSQNAGTLDVKGWEIGVGWKDHVGKLNYAVSVNVSDAKSKIVDMKGTQLLGDQATFQGSEFNEWYGYKSNGLYQSSADTVGSPRLNSSVGAGDVRYADMNKDGKLTPDDKVLLGGSMPRYIYGGTIRLDYQGLDFSLAFQGVGKKLSRLNDDIEQPFLEAFGNVPQGIVGKFWSTQNTPAQNQAALYPRLSRKAITNNFTMSDFWLVNGSYFRIKNLTLGYTFKQAVLAKAGINGLRVYIAANDLFSISHFPKYADPESGNASYPIVTTFLAGATLRF